MSRPDRAVGSGLRLTSLLNFPLDLSGTLVEPCPPLLRYDLGANDGEEGRRMEGEAREPGRGNPASE